MYTFTSRIRYSELDKNGKLSLPGLINYFQDCSTFQSEELGVGVEFLRRRKQVWVLSYWQIEITRMPRLGEQIKVGTFATAFNGLYGHRNFILYDQLGEMLSCADSIWAFIDLAKERPVRPPEECVLPYKTEEPLPMKQEGRKIARLDGGIVYPSFGVARHHLDTNEHVNNGQYVQMALNLPEDDSGVKRVRVEYKKSAVLGDEIFPYQAKEAERTVVELCDKNKNPYAIVEMVFD